MEIPDIPLNEEGDRFQTIMAIMIALVTLVGAVIAWRAAVAHINAGDADFAGLSAALNAEETLTLTNNTFHRHYRAYTSFSGNDVFSDNLDGVPRVETLRNNAQSIAATDRLFFPNRYLNRDGSYAGERQVGEAWAEASQIRDLEPSPHFEDADQARLKTNWMVGIFIGLALSLFFFTIAEGLHHGRSQLRFMMAFAGSAFLALTVIAGVIIEVTL
ncbi:MAG: hypothetical protein AAF614_07270 [Chloroflexota bacterium]